MTPGDIAFYIAAALQAHGAIWATTVAIENTGELAVRMRQLFPFMDEAAPRVAVPPLERVMNLVGLGHGKSSPQALPDRRDR